MSAALVETTGFLAALSLGLSAGALVAEAGVLVPYWRSLAPDAFLGWYQRNGGLLVRFFGPVEIAAALLAIASAAVAGIVGAPGIAWRVGAAALAVAILTAFPLYFQQANARFADGSLDPAKVPAALSRWARWHLGRCVVAVAAFAAAICAVES